MTREQKIARDERVAIMMESGVGGRCRSILRHRADYLRSKRMGTR